MTIEVQTLDAATVRVLEKVATATLTTVLLKKGLRNIWLRGTRPLKPGLPRVTVNTRPPVMAEQLDS